MQIMEVEHRVELELAPLVMEVLLVVVQVQVLELLLAMEVVLVLLEVVRMEELDGEPTSDGLEVFSLHMDY